MKTFILTLMLLLAHQLSAFAQNGGGHVGGIYSTVVSSKESYVLNSHEDVATVLYTSDEKGPYFNFYKIELTGAEQRAVKNATVGRTRKLMVYKSTLKTKELCEEWRKDVSENEPGTTIQSSCDLYQVDWGKGNRSRPVYWGRVKKDVGFVTE